LNRSLRVYRERTLWTAIQQTSGQRCFGALDLWAKGPRGVGARAVKSPVHMRPKQIAGAGRPNR